ncbi:flagellar basal body-associated FliL family protein [Methylobacterium sp. WSM2598]|uniref:flagellar basal body-associated FliL family protein n=1 Tax=Methylobacterium sp. WSM2598 TaxID=398261 RepID=UPI0003816CFB|nr:flagellar basal body-associated FliL family protein [Methylobacterium sp. WSM2598]
MADSPDSTTAPKKGKGWLLALAVLTLGAGGTGGGLGYYLLTTVEKAVDKKKTEEQARAEKVLTYTGDLSTRSVGPLVTNLVDSGEMWVRLEGSIIYRTGAVANPDVAVAEIRQDILAYLRTVSLAQIQGASGLMHLREDLNERVMLRTKGAVHELVVETLIIQ